MVRATALLPSHSSNRNYTRLDTDVLFDSHEAIKHAKVRIDGVSHPHITDIFQVVLTLTAGATNNCGLGQLDVCTVTLRPDQGDEMEVLKQRQICWANPVDNAASSAGVCANRNPLNLLQVPRAAPR
jgi:hypothetical protein